VHAHHPQGIELQLRALEHPQDVDGGGAARLGLEHAFLAQGMKLRYGVRKGQRAEHLVGAGKLVEQFRPCLTRLVLVTR
jgi:hypothetical protein